MKRLADLVISVLALMLFSPILIPILILVWMQDYQNPFYIATRIGKDEKPFRMVKIRSMIVGADKSGVDSTSNTDNRITNLGKFIRAYKIDELGQLINVLYGNMSLVGPRPNVERETRLYTHKEKQLLTVKPGVTDFASIVFADEGDILSGHDDPDLAYNQLIRPGKSALGIFYVENSGILLDLKIMFLTGFSFVSREATLKKLQSLLEKLNAPKDLIRLAGRQEKLMPSPPPGSTQIIKSREI